MLAYLILAVYIVPLFIVAPRLPRARSTASPGAPTA